MIRMLQEAARLRFSHLRPLSDACGGWIGVMLQMSFLNIDLSNFRIWQSAECRFRKTLVVVHLALHLRNLACGQTKFRGAPVIASSMNESSSYSPPAKCYQRNNGLVSTSSRCIENTEHVLSSSRLSPNRRLFVDAAFSRQHATFNSDDPG